MVPPVGSVSGSQSAAIPDKPNLLHLHRATLDPNWPKQLPAPSIFGYKQLGSRLFIRDMSEMLAAEIPLALAGGGAPQQQLASPIPPYPSIVLMGNSGVGKSTFMVWYMSQLLQPRVGMARPTIVYVHNGFGRTKFARMRGSGPVGPAERPNRLTIHDITLAPDIEVFTHELSDPDTFLFVDYGPNMTPHICLTWHAQTISALSPESCHIAERRSKDISMIRSLRIIERFVPIWSEAELQAARRIIHPIKAERSRDAEVGTGAVAAAAGCVSPVSLADELMPAGFDADWVSRRFHQLGGVPRFMFDECIGSLRDDVESAIHRWRQMVDFDREQALDGRVEGELSSMILHYSVHVPIQPITREAREAIIASWQEYCESRSDAPRAPPEPLPFQLQHPPLRLATTFIRDKIGQF